MITCSNPKSYWAVNVLPLASLTLAPYTSAFWMPQSQGVGEHAPKAWTRSWPPTTSNDSFTKWPVEATLFQVPTNAGAGMAVAGGAPALAAPSVGLAWPAGPAPAGPGGRGAPGPARAGPR